MPDKKRQDRVRPPVSDDVKPNTQLDGDLPSGPATPAAEMQVPDVSNQDLSADFETPIGILDDLLAIAIDEIGNGGGRAIALLLAAIRYLHDIKAINRQLQLAAVARHEK
jgi:hypothetical protein